MPIITMRCTNEKCGLEYQILETYSHADRRWMLGGKHDGELDIKCDGCGQPEAEGEVVVSEGFGFNKDLGGEAGVGSRFPRWDRSLGMRIHDAAHLRRELAARGLRQTEGEVDFAAMVDDERNEAEKDEASYNAYVKEMSEGPNREVYAKAKAHAMEQATKRRAG